MAAPTKKTPPAVKLPTLAAVRVGLAAEAAKRFANNAQLAEAAGLPRSTVNTALGAAGDVRFETLTRLMQTVGVDFVWLQKLA